MRTHTHGRVLAIALAAWGVLGLRPGGEARGALPVHQDRADGRGGAVGRGLFQRAGRGGRSPVRRQDRGHAALAPGQARRVRAADRRGRPPTASARRCRLRGASRWSGPASTACSPGPKETPFLLRHYPKAVAGSPDELNAFTRFTAPEVRLEIMPTFETDRVRLVALRRGEADPWRGLPRGRLRPDRAQGHRRVRRLGHLDAPRAGAVLDLRPGRDRRRAASSGQAVRRDPRVRHAGLRLAARPRRRRPRGRRALRGGAGDPRRLGGFPGLLRRGLGRRSTADRSPARSRSRPTARSTVEVDDPVARPWLEDQLASIAMHRLPDGDRPPSPCSASPTTERTTRSAGS